MQNQDPTRELIEVVRELRDRLDTLTAPTPRMLTVDEAAHTLGVSVHTVRRLCDGRKLRAVQAGPRAALRIPAAEIDRYIDRHQARPVRRRT